MLTSHLCDLGVLIMSCGLILLLVLVLLIELFSRVELLKAWLALTSIKYHDNPLILMLFNQWLAPTMLRATSPGFLVFLPP